MDVGVPDGGAVGLSVRPFEWLRVGAAATYNAIAPGGRIGVTLDPLPGPLGLTLTAEGGHCWSGSVPGVSSISAVTYSYANLHAGLEMGNRSSFRFFLHGGVSYVDAQLAPAARAGMKVAEVSYAGFVAPTLKIGFAQHF